MKEHQSYGITFLPANDKWSTEQYSDSRRFKLTNVKEKSEPSSVAEDRRVERKAGLMGCITGPILCFCSCIIMLSLRTWKRSVWPRCQVLYIKRPLGRLIRVAAKRGHELHRALCVGQPAKSYKQEHSSVRTLSLSTLGGVYRRFQLFRCSPPTFYFNAVPPACSNLRVFCCNHEQLQLL